MRGFPPPGHERQSVLHVPGDGHLPGHREHFGEECKPAVLVIGRLTVLAPVERRVWGRSQLLRLVVALVATVAFHGAHGIPDGILDDDTALPGRRTRHAPITDEQAPAGLLAPGVKVPANTHRRAGDLLEQPWPRRDRDLLECRPREQRQRHSVAADPVDTHHDVAGGVGADARDLRDDLLVGPGLDLGPEPADTLVPLLPHEHLRPPVLTVTHPELAGEDQQLLVLVDRKRLDRGSHEAANSGAERHSSQDRYPLRRFRVARQTPPVEPAVDGRKVERALGLLLGIHDVAPQPAIDHQRDHPSRVPLVHRSVPAVDDGDGLRAESLDDFAPGGPRLEDIAAIDDDDGVTRKGPVMRDERARNPEILRLPAFEECASEQAPGRRVLSVEPTDDLAEGTPCLQLHLIG
jgi:hypothetical protein